MRDLALILNNSPSSFEIKWDKNKNAINLVPSGKYSPTGGELKIDENLKFKKSNLSSSNILLNGEKINLTAYTIDGNNYFKLPDLVEALGFIVDLDSKESTIIIKTDKK